MRKRLINKRRSGTTNSNNTNNNNNKSNNRSDGSSANSPVNAKVESVDPMKMTCQLQYAFPEVCYDE